MGARGRPRLKARLAILAGWLLLVLSVPGAAAAATTQAQTLEYAVKANYLVRFGAFVDWPQRAFDAAADPVVICVVGQDPFGPLLDRAADGQSVNGRPVRVRRLERIGARSGCHIAYLGRTPGQSVAQAVSAVDGEPVLTVTDSMRGSERGMIHFAVAENRVRFHVDDERASRSGLSISSRLLGLALSVRSRGQA